MVRYDVYEDKVRALKKTLEEAGYSLDVDNLRIRLKELEAELEKPEVWSDIEKSKHVSREAQQIRNKLDVFDKAEKAISAERTLTTLTTLGVRFLSEDWKLLRVVTITKWQNLRFSLTATLDAS